MRFKRLIRRSEIKKGQLDIAPLVDVVFLLLIFFMLTSNFVLQPGIRVSLPKAITGEVLSSQTLAITLTRQDLLFLNDEPIAVNQLLPRIAEAAEQKKAVLLKADTGASLGRVVEIWDLCREAGVLQINIATNQKNPEAA